MAKKEPMKNTDKAICIIIFALFFSVFAGKIDTFAQNAMDLGDCYKSALKQSETIAISEETVVQAEEQLNQAWASVSPKILFRWQELWQDTSAVPAYASEFFKARQPQGSFKVRLSPLTFYKEFAALKSAMAFTQQRENEMMRAKQLLYLDVSQSFWAVIQIENQIQITQSQRNSIKDRIRELGDRVRIGRSREAEVVSVQSQLAVVEADIEDLKRALAAARDLLAFLTGEDREIPLTDTISIPQAPMDLAVYLDSAMNRMDIKSLNDAVTTARAAVEVVRSGHFPSFSVEGNYYFERTGVQKDIDWDVLAAIEVPIFSWGQVKALVREAESRLRAADLALQRLQRQAKTEVRAALEALRASLSELEIYEKAVSLAERNHSLQKRDYRLGLVSNLEVLQALNNLYDARLRRDQVKYAAKINAIRLQVAAGDMRINEVEP